MTRVRFRYAGHQPDDAAIRRLFGEDPGGALGRDLDARARRVLVRAQTLVGVDSGRLLASIHRERGTSAVGPYVDVTAGVPGLTNYLGYHHFGSGPHVIRPNRRRALRFVVGGRVVFATKVNHPGSAGTYFLTRALRAAG